MKKKHITPILVVVLIAAYFPVRYIIEASYARTVDARLAAEMSDPSLLLFVLKYDSNALSDWSEQGTILAYASPYSTDNLIIILDHGVDPNVKDKRGITALHSASNVGHLKNVRILLKRNANPNVQDKWGFTPLHMAAQNGHLEVLKDLISSGAEHSPVNSKGKTALELASDHGHDECVAFLNDIREGK